MTELALIDVIADMESFKALTLDKLAANINECYQSASVTARKLAIDIARMFAGNTLVEGRWHRMAATEVS